MIQAVMPGSIRIRRRMGCLDCEACTTSGGWLWRQGRRRSGEEGGWMKRR